MRTITLTIDQMKAARIAIVQYEDEYAASDEEIEALEAVVAALESAIAGD